MQRTTEDLASFLGKTIDLASDEGIGAALLKALNGLHPADIAEAMQYLPDHQSLVIFHWLDNARAAQVLSTIDTELAQYLEENSSANRITDMLVYLPMDEAAEIVAGSPQEKQEYLLTNLGQRNPEDAAEVRVLLSYGPNTAGRFMTDKFIRLLPYMTVDHAFATIRHADPDVETLTNLYVVEKTKQQEERLIGVLSLRDLVRAKPYQKIADIMVKELITVMVDTDQEDVARLIAKYDFLAMPVLDRQGYLAGIITVDDVIDVLVEEQTEDILKQSAITAEPGVITQPYFSVPIWRVVRSRVSWLILLFVAETTTGSVLRHFEHDLSAVTALAFFVPLLIGTGGNTGAQTVSTIIRGLALKEIRFKDSIRVLFREFGSGLLLGLLLGLIAFGRAMMWNSGLSLSLVVGLSILAIVIWANTIGALIPLMAQRVKVDPAMVSAPLITTLVDATGLVIYFFIANMLLEQLH